MITGVQVKGRVPLTVKERARILQENSYGYMEHLSLEIFDIGGTGSKYAHLPEDVSITITDTSEVFASGDVWSYSFTLNTEANVHIFGSAGEMHGARLHEQINNRRARLWVEGQAMYLGYLKLADEVDVDDKGNVDVSFESGQKTFDQLIEGAKANQVPLMGDVVYGMALWRKRWVKYWLALTGSLVFKDKSVHATMPGKVHSATYGNYIPFEADGEDENVAVQEYPRMVFPKGEFKNLDTGETEEVNFLNTDYPYDDEHPYCNVAVCYQRQGYEKKNDKGELIPDYSSEPEPQRGYEVMPANRVNSAPNFFVIYWIRCLMKHLGIHIDENQMMDVTDLRRLFFVNTRCEYKEPEHIRKAPYTEGFGRYTFSGERLVPEHFPLGDDDNVTVNPYDMTRMIDYEKSGFVTDIKNIDYSMAPIIYRDQVDHLTIDIEQATYWSHSEKEIYERKNSYLHEAFATPECFPDAEISEVLESLESGFGIRLLFSDNYKRVRIVLLRNLFRSEDVQDVACEVISNTKQENCIRGFRMTYGESTDTAFYYKGFADMLPHQKVLWKDNSDKHDYSHWKLDAKYANIIHKISAFDKTCYVTPVNGNAYGIKVDKDAKRYEELHPSLFEYAGFMDAEDGDCTGEENTIEEVSVGFKPAIMNDLNFEDERDGKSEKQRFALFVSDDMKPRRPDLLDDKDYNDAETFYDVENGLYAKDEDGKYKFSNMMADDGVVKPGEFYITSDMFAAMKDLTVYTETWPFITLPGAFTVAFDIDGHVNEGYRLYLQDNFEANDEGITPVEKHEWGLTLGIMRGSGEDAGVKYQADPDDWEGNDAWEIEPGSSITTHPDMCDNYGKEWDYNGQQEDIGMKEGRISLKLRAEKPNPKFNPDLPESDDNRRYLEIETERLRGRGLCDQFYKEYSYWVRNARIAKVTARMELAQLQTIDKTKRVRVGDIYGFIRKIQYTVSQKTGLGMVTMEIMYL